MDNMATVRKIKNHIHCDRIKHVEIDRHFILDKIDSSLIILSNLPAGSQGMYLKR